MEVETPIEISTQRFKRLFSNEMRPLMTSENMPYIQLMWALMKIRLENDKIASNTTELIKDKTKTATQKVRLEELFQKIESNQKTISDSLVKSAERVRCTKKVENIPIIPQDALELEHSLLTLKTLNEMNKENLDRLKKIEIVKELGTSLLRNEGSLITRQPLTPFN
ncbi:hypothetical protein EIN_031400 [Entamoeba invadens IP1]|uniref:Uncharacterized protein n=1 Tax=Entamoeba invadens IP1 TaxID=370355 RepID=A0A0A1TY80_ENTIV|nr:hypothetical protein EIN_031400 [Entamoeba invadens IP1]ELP86429.1 hypothetical protein EIN_031400 [Entamoeba invadens IP1]|eukprot:XP_004185775.1 hypothetical protein EIN_031400 [Entamoeba invadens IP1]